MQDGGSSKISNILTLERRHLFMVEVVVIHPLTLFMVEVVVIHPLTFPEAQTPFKKSEA